MGVEYYPERKIVFDEFVQSPLPNGMWFEIAVKENDHGVKSACLMDGNACVWAYSGRSAFEDQDATTFELYGGNNSSEGWGLLQKIAAKYDTKIFEDYWGQVITPTEVRAPQPDEQRLDLSWRRPQLK